MHLPLPRVCGQEGKRGTNSQQPNSVQDAAAPEVLKYHLVPILAIVRNRIVSE